MQLRKVGNHPLLLRVYYDDDMIAKIAQILRKKDDQYKKDTLSDIIGMKRNKNKKGRILHFFNF